MKKTLAMLLALVMVLSCLAACEKGPAEETKGNDAPKETTEYVAPTQNTQPKEELGKLPLTEEDVTITIGLPQDVKTEDYETNAYTLWLEEQTGINLEFKYFASDKAEAVTQLNLMMAGNEELPDILWGFSGIDSAMMFELGEDEYFIDIKDYFSEYGYWFWEAYNEVPEAERANIFRYGTDPNNGAIYSFPHYSESKSDNCATEASINAKWLEAIGEEAPTTVDELYNVLKKFATEDPNGNGKADEIALLGSGEYRADIVAFIINAFVYCVDSNIFNATDGEIWVPYTTDEYRQAMIYLHKLYAEGLLSSLTYTIAEAAELKALMTPADGTAIVGLAGASRSLHYEKDNPAALEYVALAPLKAATELGGYGAYMGNTFNYYTFISSDCEDPVLAFKLLDFMTSQESFLRMRYGVYGEDWVYADEGAVSASGTVAAIKALDGSVYGSQNNRCWHVLRSVIMPLHLWAGTWVDDGSWTATTTKNLTIGKIANYAAADHPEEVVQKLVFTDAENEIVAGLKTPIMDYVKEARAMFISGVLDPNDDAAWNTYLSNLESQGLSQYIEVAQTAYTRMTAE